MTRILVLGATGDTGWPVVARALAGGHEVTAFARQPGVLAGREDRLQVAPGDVRDPVAVERAAATQDSVISIVSQPYTPMRRVTLFSEAARNTLDAMQVHGVRRYVCVTSGGTRPRREAGSPLVFELLFKAGSVGLFTRTCDSWSTW